MKLYISFTVFLIGLSNECFVNSKNGKEQDVSCTSQIKFPVTESGISEYPFKLSVYGIPMFATSDWSKEKLNHVASVLAELLDQDEDGCADDPLVLNEILLRKNGNLNVAVLLPTRFDDVAIEDAEIALRDAGYFIGTLEAEDETRPDCTGLNFTQTCCDASIEELFHLVTSFGHGYAYPSIFRTGWCQRSEVNAAMDVARGGRFRKIPVRYPSSAWYTYYDETCEYDCQGTEYIWWGYCAFSGVCEGRSGAPFYEDEFRYLTKSEFENGDLKLSKLFQDSGSTYILPTMHVDGKYHGCEVCPNGPNHGGKQI